MRPIAFLLLATLLLLSFLLPFTLLSCLKTSAVKEEYGKVIEKQYSPAKSSDGGGFTSSGKAVFVHESEEQKFILLFKCQHGVLFPINRMELYGRLEKGDSVKIKFKEIYAGERLYDFDFIDAQKVILK